MHNCKKYIRPLLSAALSLTIFSLSAQTVREGGFKGFVADLEYEVNAGVNIGGATPLPLPAEIRKIDSYSPGLNLSIGASATKWLGPEKKWGASVGLRFENKGMETKATVKNYGMSIIQNGGTLSGRWTGKVQTKYHSQQLVIPITGVWRAHRRLSVDFGPYFAIALGKNFDGYVYEGYLREGDPTGQKVEFMGDAKAPYDFGDNLRTFQWGVQGGVSWTAYKHLHVNANLSWGLNDIFNSSFKTVTFNLYPIYLNVGFGYVF